MEDLANGIGKKRKGGNAGLDFHDPNREAKKQSRQHASTLNFALSPWC